MQQETGWLFRVYVGDEISYPEICGEYIIEKNQTKTMKYRSLFIKQPGSEIARP